MIYLLWGADTYRSLEKLHAITAEFRAKSGEFDVQEFDAETDAATGLSERLKAKSLFQKKKLITVRRPAAGKEPFQKELKAFLKTAAHDPDIIVVLWQPGEAKKLAAMVEDLEGKSQEFKEMSAAEERRWLAAFIRQENLSLPENEIERLLGAFSGDTWRLVHEAEKCSLGGELGAAEAAEQKNYAFLDAFLVHRESALEALIRLRASGANDFMLFGSVAAHIRNLIAAASGAELSGSYPAAREAARRKLPKIKREVLEPTLEKLFDEDIKIKTGRTDPYTSLIDLVILENQYD